MKLKMIKNEEEYQEAQAVLEKLMDVEPGTQEEEELELLAFLIEKFEKERFPIALPDPIEAIKFRMEQEGLTRKDLEKYIGTQSKVSEVLNRKRPLSLAMIRSLHEGLGVSTEVLLQRSDKTTNDLDEEFPEDNSSLEETKQASFDISFIDTQRKETNLPIFNWPRLSDPARRLLIANGYSAEVQEVDEQLFSSWVDDHLDQARAAIEQAEFSDALQYIRTLRQGLEQLCSQSPLVQTYCQAILLLEEQILLTSHFYKGIVEQSRIQKRVLAEVREKTKTSPYYSTDLPEKAKLFHF